MVATSVTVVLAWAGLRLKNFAQFRKYGILTLLLAGGFMVVKGFEYSAEFSAGLFPWTDNYMAIYFTMTGLHTLHVFGGMLVATVASLIFVPMLFYIVQVTKDKFAKAPVEKEASE